MMELQGEQDYRNKRKYIIDRFSPEFIEKYRNDMLFNLTIEWLLRDIDIYTILEHILSANAEMFEKWKNAVLLQPPPVHIYQVPIGYKLVKEAE